MQMELPCAMGFLVFNMRIIIKDPDNISSDTTHFGSSFPVEWRAIQYFKNVIAAWN